MTSSTETILSRIRTKGADIGEFMENEEKISVSSQSSADERTTPNTLSRAKSRTAPIKLQPITSSANVILSAITRDLSSFVTINKNCKSAYINNFGLGDKEFRR